MPKSNALDALADEWLSEYQVKHAQSAAAGEASAQFIAATQRTRFSSGMPYPLYIAQGEGAYFTDLDGNEFIDCNAGWNANLFGRGNPAIADAVASEARRVGAPGGAMHPSLLRDEFAQIVCTRVPGAERLLFAPSGSEANSYALRLARSYTGNHKILRVHGGFHGQNDYLLQGGSSLRGLPPAAAEGHIDMPYNDLEESIRLIEEHRHELAAVIAEPMMTIPGAVHQRDGYIQGVRAAALDVGVPFILDDVIAGCRFAAGGATEFLGLTPPPDLIVMGKMLGSGLPVAVVAGRADIVEQPISASNTYAQNSVNFAAAIAGMKLATHDVYDRLNRQGANLRRRLREIANNLDVPLQVTGDGPCAGLHFTNADVVNAAVADAANQNLWRIMCLGVTNRGIGISSRTFGPIAPFTDVDVDRVLATFAEVLEAIDRAVSDSPQTEGVTS